MSDIKYNTLILAAFIHDIGKPLHFANYFFAEGPYKHVAYSEKMIDHFLGGVDVGEFKGVISGPAELKSEHIDIKLLKDLVKTHHDRSAGSKLSGMLKKADHWSASERTWDEDYNDSPLMESPFKRLYKGADGSRQYYRPDPLTKEKLAGAVFPRESTAKPDKAELRERCGCLLEDVKAVAEAISRNECDFDTAMSLFDVLMYKHFWMWPSSRKFEEMRDISLYDHLKVTSAISACLYQFNHANPNEDISEAKAFRLVIGDFSGIQDYIFDIRTKAAAKRLRARSFFVQALSENISELLLNKLRLPQTCRLLSAGGKFVLLAPSHKAEEIRSFIEEAQREMYEGFNGEICLNMAAGEPFKGEQFTGKNGAFRSLYEELQNRLAEAKKQPFRGGLQNGAKWDPDAFVHKLQPNSGECHMCGKPDILEDDKCSRCKEDEEKGRMLVKGNFIAYEKDSVIPVFKVIETLAKKHDKKAVRLTAVNPEVFKDLRGLEQNLCPLSIKFMANYVPKEDDQPMDFADIAKKTKSFKRKNAADSGEKEENEGIELLGVLKADVDDLGKIFSLGIGGDRLTITRLTSLSRFIDLFFSGYIETLVRKEYENCYCVYAGGDDLLIAGPWDVMIDLSQRISEDFGRFACGRDDIHLSAGLAFVKPTYPVLNAVDLADRQLKAAKNNGKDSISIWDHPLKWEEFGKIKPFFEKLAELLHSGKISTGFVYNLLLFGRMNREYELDGKKDRLRWKPLLAYQLGRHNDKGKLEIDFENGMTFAGWLLNILREEDRAKLERANLDIMAQYALYRNR